MHGPYTDALHLCEMFDDVRTFHFMQRTMFDSAVREFLREVFDIRSFLTGEPRRAHFLKRHRAYHFGSRELSFGEQADEPRVYRLRRRARNLLVNNRTHKSRERIFTPLQVRRSMLFDKRREALVAQERTKRGQEIIFHY